MRQCLKCQGDLHNRTKIDGKWYNLQNRKYCLKCSPFRGHNTRKLVLGSTNPKIGLTVNCEVCKKDFVYRHKGHTYTQCGTCHVRARRIANKQKSIDYKGGRCERCGYNKCLTALEFHHKDPSLKDFGLSGPTILAWDTVKAELDKCLCLCANCHREVHEEILNDSRKQ